MAYVQPAPAAFKARFPNFSDVDNAYIQLLLDDAVLRFGDGWYERDRALAQMLFVAHVLASEGAVDGSGGSGGGGASTGNVKRRKVGDVEVEFAGMSASSSGGGALGDYLSGTMYGRQLLLLMRLNFPAITVV